MTCWRAALAKWLPQDETIAWTEQQLMLHQKLLVELPMGPPCEEETVVANGALLCAIVAQNLPQSQLDLGQIDWSGGDSSSQQRNLQLLREAVDRLVQQRVVDVQQMQRFDQAVQVINLMGFSSCGPFRFLCLEAHNTRKSLQTQDISTLFRAVQRFCPAGVTSPQVSAPPAVSKLPERPKSAGIRPSGIPRLFTAPPKRAASQTTSGIPSLSGIPTLFSSSSSSSLASASTCSQVPAPAPVTPPAAPAPPAPPEAPPYNQETNSQLPETSSLSSSKMTLPTRIPKIPRLALQTAIGDKENASANQLLTGRDPSSSRHNNTDSNTSSLDSSHGNYYPANNSNSNDTSRDTMDTHEPSTTSSRRDGSKKRQRGKPDIRDYPNSPEFVSDKSSISLASSNEDLSNDVSLITIVSEEEVDQEPPETSDSQPQHPAGWNQMAMADTHPRQQILPQQEHDQEQGEDEQPQDPLTSQIAIATALRRTLLRDNLRWKLKCDELGHDISFFYEKLVRIEQLTLDHKEAMLARETQRQEHQDQQQLHTPPKGDPRASRIDVLAVLIDRIEGIMSDHQ